MRVRERDQLPRERVATRRRPRLLAHLDEPETPRERAFRAREERFLAQILRARDTHCRGQRERVEDASVGRQERRHVERPGTLPRERLAVVADRLAVEGEHAEEVELDVRVRVDVLLHDPGRGATHDDAELLDELARERVARRLARLELPARELPVARVGLARGALREQHAAVGAHDDRGRDARHAHRQGRRLNASCPAQSFANCQATRPERDPRCSANCSASRVRASASFALAGAPTPNDASQPATAAR